MPNAPVPAAATGLPSSSQSSRRLFLAAGPAAAVFASLHTTAAAAVEVKPTAIPIAELINRHRAAWRRFEDIFDFEDRIEESDPAYSIAAAEYVRWNEAEEAALDAVCAASIRTLSDARIKGEYLRAFLTRSELTEWQYRLVIGALAAAAA